MRLDLEMASQTDKARDMICSYYMILHDLEVFLYRAL